MLLLSLDAIRHMGSSTQAFVEESKTARHNEVTNPAGQSLKIYEKYMLN